jgi:TrmH RNA methyltransferase
MTKNLSKPERRGSPKTQKPTQTKKSEDVELVYGFRAGLAAFEKRRDDITRIGVARERVQELGELLAFADARRVPWSELPENELARIASSTNHEGLVLETKPRKWSSLSDVADALIRTRGFAVALDRVRNPYNVGAILRSAAFFGMESAILGAIAPHPALAADAVRVAEGGVEHLRLARTTDLAESLSRFRGRGLRVVGAESDGIHTLFEYAFQAPTILVLGHEREGLSPRVRSVCDALVKIPGSGAVESLNVGIAASLFIAELARTKKR